MESRVFAILLLLSLSHEFHRSCAQTWIKAGYWLYQSNFPVADINSALYTHLICAFADLNPSTFEVSLPPTNEHHFSTFTDAVKRKNPAVSTLLSIRSGTTNSSMFFELASQPSSRRSFIESTIKTARLYGFHGIDFWWGWPAGTNLTNTTNMGILFDEWRTAVKSEAGNSSKPHLLLTMAAHYLPILENMTYPIGSIRRNLNWVNIVAYDYYVPLKNNFTGAHAALYDPSSRVNTDFGIGEWLRRGLPSSKVLLGLPFHGYAWTLVNPRDNGIGAAASGPAVTQDGSISYVFVKSLVRSYGANSVYNLTYKEHFFTTGLIWIVYDDVEAIRDKVSYAKEKGLLGYCVFQVPNDDNWALSQAAAHVDVRDHQNKRQLLIIVLTVSMGLLLLVFILLFSLRRRLLNLAVTIFWGEEPLVTARNLNNNDDPCLQAFSFASIEAATHKFSVENKLGQGGYGSVYMGKLKKGQEIAVKRLSKTSQQGLEEFKNEVLLTAKLQHVNLVKVLGFCVEREEKMLIYEYMPNKSLDFYLYDPIRRKLLDWEKRVQIIEGITQGLLYLQEYSRLTIIHRDLKASNILLDIQMKPKISDFGLAKIFQKDEQEANTGRIVGTYGYVPPEYVKKGLYSTKYDVYSFGVLLLQIISGKRNTCYYGPYENLSLLEYAYDLWKEGDGLEFMDTSLDDSSSACKLMKCMQIALLCVQEKGEDRPSMLEVYAMLKSEATVTTIPRRPAFSTKRDETEGHTSTSQPDICSNEASITELVPR